MTTDSNMFTAISKARWAKGEDGEVVARELAQSLLYVIQEGKGKDTNLAKEWKRLLNDDPLELENLDVVRSHPQELDKIRQAPKELAELFQEYVDEAPMGANGLLEGLYLKPSEVVELFNDFLLFLNAGLEPPLKVKDH